MKQVYIFSLVFFFSPFQDSFTLKEKNLFHKVQTLFLNYTGPHFEEVLDLESQIGIYLNPFFHNWPRDYKINYAQLS